MNINSLANAVKPAVLPGEELRVRVIQEGKEAGPGRRLPRRRHDDRHRGRRAPYRPRPGRVGDPRPADRRRPDDLRPAAARLSGARPGRPARTSSSSAAGRVDAGWAAPTSSRAEIGGRPLLAWTLAALAAAPAVERIVVVTSAERRAEVAGARWLPASVVDVVAGGERRQESVHAGFAALDRHGAGRRPGVVLVHDARPAAGRPGARRARSRRRPPGTGRRSRSCRSPRPLKRIDGDLVGATVDRTALGGGADAAGRPARPAPRGLAPLPAGRPRDLHRRGRPARSL